MMVVGRPSVSLRSSAASATSRKETVTNSQRLLASHSKRTSRGAFGGSAGISVAAIPAPCAARAFHFGALALDYEPRFAEAENGLGLVALRLERGDDLEFGHDDLACTVSRSGVNSGQTL